MFSPLTICLVLIGFGSSQQTGDPCNTKKEILEPDIRTAAYQYDPKIETPLCDKYRINASGEWFRIEIGKEMIRNESGIRACGTDTGIWMKGTIPKYGESEKPRIACAPGYVGDCEKTYNIKVKNCKTHYVYFLVPPSNCPEAYCFGYGIPGSITREKTEKPRIKYKLQKREGRNKVYYQELMFKCVFTPKMDTALLYKIFWYINNATNPFRTSKIVTKDDLHLAYLTVDNGLNTITLGIQLACRVRLYLDPNASPGPFSERSDYFYAGLQAVQTSYDVNANDHADIKFRLTVPFGCPFEHVQDKNPIDCTMTVAMAYPPSGTCTDQSVGGINGCGKTVLHSKWNETQVFKAKHFSGTAYFLIKHYQIHFRAEQPGKLGKYWKNTRLTGLHLHIWPTVNKQWEGLQCYAQSDPHMKTFDGKTYENQHPGTYTLYKFKDKYENTMEIQHKVTPCNGNPHIYCTCGVAVRSAADVFMIDRCPDRNPWYFGFPSCIENTLHVKKKKGNEWKYWIHFLTGTHLEATLRHQYNAYTIELFVFPSRLDFNTSDGLCSRLGSNTYIRRDGLPTTNSQSFATSWKVDKSDDLFLMDEKTIKGFSPMKQHKRLCRCDSSDKTDPNTVKEEALCTDAGAFDCEQTLPVQRDICFEKQARRRRSLFSHIPDNMVPINDRKVYKRSVPVEKYMSIDEAKEWCADFMNASIAFKECSKVPSVDPQDAINLCVLDIQATNTTDWASAPREGMKSMCFKELRQNQTLQTADDGQKESLAEQIHVVSCPNECSGNGICENGTCTCRKGYGAGDCSINFNDPPHVFGVNLNTGGLCDKPICKAASLEGDPFLDRPELTCRMEGFEINFKGENKYVGVYYTHAIHNTVADIRCPFPHLREKRSIPSNDSFVLGYKVAVSNNGKSYSDNHLMYILDSTCQDTMNVSGELRFVLRKGFCFIRGRCVADGVVSGLDSCRLCNPDVDQLGWTTINSKPGCRKHSQSSSNSMLWIIGVVIGCTSLLIVVIIIVSCWMKKYRYVRDAFPEVSPPTYQDTRKMAFEERK